MSSAPALFFGRYHLNCLTLEIRFLIKQSYDGPKLSNIKRLVLSHLSFQTIFYVQSGNGELREGLDTDYLNQCVCLFTTVL